MVEHSRHLYVIFMLFKVVKKKQAQQYKMPNSGLGAELVSPYQTNIWMKYVEFIERNGSVWDKKYRLADSLMSILGEVELVQTILHTA